MNIQFFSGLRARLILFVLLGSTPLIILLIYSGLELRSEVTHDVQQKTAHMVMMVANEQRHLVKETHQLLAVLAHVPQVRDGDVASCNSFLANLLRKTVHYVNLGVIRPNGDLICSGVSAQRVLNVKGRSYFKRALKNRDFSVGDYQIGRITHVAVMVFSYPVYDDKQKLKLVLYAALPLTWIKHTITEAGLLPESVINVVEHTRHRLLAHYPEGKIKIGSSVEKTALARAMNTEADTGAARIRGLDGVDRLYTFMHLHDLAAGNDIDISLGVPAAAAYSKSDALMVRSLVILLFVVVLVLLLAWYGSDVFVLKRLKGLLAVTRRLASGKLDARADVSDSSNEISQLGHEFNQMAGALEKRDSEIRRAETLLRKSERDLRRIIETIPDIIYTATTTSNFAAIFVSPALTRILGYTPEEFMTDPDRWAACIYDEDKERILTQVRSALDTMENEYVLEYRMWHKDRKTYRWFEDRVHIERDDTGHATALYGVMTDITERKRFISELEHKALYDSLTELPNRTLLQDQIQHAIKVAKRDGLPVVVMLIDIVRLSDINDILGYGGGDLVLQEIASRLQKSLRESDIAARVGGDEFVLVLQDVLFKDVGVAIDKIHGLFEQHISVEDTSLEIESVLGIAMYPEHGETADILLQRASIAMRVAKKESIDFCIYSSKDDEHSLRRLKLFGELRQAITNKELLLYYQPQIDISTGRIISVEALARWPHLGDGMIPPDDFIPMVEQSGLIGPFTLWVLEEAIMQLRHWSQQGINLDIAVNLSARNLLDPQLPDAIAAMLESHNLSSAQLTLEVTESAIMTRPENALKVLTKLHDMGFKLSIDDFGTGYSSLAYLKKFPVDELKIDQSFVFDLADHDDDAVIVRSTIDLAHNMGMKVVAEGVESEEILSVLSILDCDLAQGYYMSRPLSIQDLDNWLAESPWGISDSSGTI